jgi:enterobactin synthetase component D
VPSLFPAWVAAAEEWSDPLADSLELAPGDDLPASLAKAVPKRQREFLAGRRLARRALAALDGAWAHAPLERGDDGAPVWPRGAVGSITHTRGYVAAVAAPAGVAWAIGLDAEAPLDPGRAERVRARIATADEIDAFSRQTGLEPADALTVIFSAKEALYKCLAARVGRRFDHLEARIAASETGGFVATLTSTLNDEWRSGDAVDGRFDRTAGVIRAGIVIAARAS